MVSHFSNGKRGSSRITVKIDGVYFPMDKFTKTIENFHTALSEIDRETSFDGTPSLDWSVASLEQGSLVITAESYAVSDEVSPERGHEVIDTFREGIQLIRQRPEQPVGFTNRALKSIKNLSDLISPEDFAEITFSSQNWMISISKEISANVDNLTKSFYRYHDSIEGELVSISLSRGMRVGIRDHVTQNIIQCYFPDHLFQEAKEALGKRVLVFGLITQHLHGRKVNIRVEQIENLPKPTELSSLSNLINFMNKQNG